MANNNEVTALEEIQRYYKKVKDVAIPMVQKIMPENETKEAKKKADLETANRLFNDSVDDEKGGWVDVIPSGEMPNEKYQEAYRLATGIGPIQVASAVLQRKISSVSAAAAERVSQVPGAVRIVAEGQVERLVEGVGRVTVSDAVEGMLQRYPLLDRWRRAIFRGRDSGSQVLDVPSPPPEFSSGPREPAQLAETRFCVGDDSMEDVPLGEDETEEDKEWEECE